MFVLRDEEEDGDTRGLYGVGRNKRERHESITRRRWCIGVRTCDRISVLRGEHSSQKSRTCSACCLLVLHSQLADGLQISTSDL